MDFGKTLIVMLVLFLSGMLALTLDVRQAKTESDGVFEGRGVWVWATSFSSDPDVGPLERRGAFKNFSELGFNFVLLLVKSSDGWLYYNSSIGPVDPRYKWDPLEVAVEEAHRFGLELHAWLCIFRDIKLAREKPDLAMVDINGNVSTEWVCPGKEEVRSYMKRLISEVAFQYDVDGIHLDYIRYPNRIYCYCSKCQENWKREHPEIPWPPQPTDSAWIKMRQDIITSFIEETRIMLKGINSKIELSATVFPIPEDAIYNRMQNHPLWAEKGIVDFITPMTYTSNSSLFQQYLEEIVKVTKCKVLIYAGIGLHELLKTSNPNEVLETLINTTRIEKYPCDCSIVRVDGQVMFRYKFLEPFDQTFKKVYTRQATPPHSEAIPPEIGEPLLEPSNIPPHQSVDITVKVMDYQTRVRNVTLWYRANSGTWWFTIMNQVCPNTYHITIPGYGNCTHVYYMIEAYDIIGNRAFKEGNYYVIPELPNANLILTLTYLTTVYIFMKGKRSSGRGV